ncbi:SPOR domain-containing protein [Undibacterium sp. SXout20W]|uniref:SPOR domain-containing protein n=1 Tax=Undibacterium sp. SXout20W TaxID=3413051 RepID=UPI003BEF6E5B
MGLLSRFKQKKESSDSHDNGEFRSRTEEDSIASRSRGKKSENTRKSKVIDPVLPEKKRARRRLIGATALALAAIIGLPMVFDSEPKSLPDDITVKIPSKDKVQDVDSVKPAEPTPPKKANLMDVDPGEEIIDPVAPATDKSTASQINKVVSDNKSTSQLDPASLKISKPDVPVPVKAEVKPEVSSSEKVAEVKTAAKFESKADKKAETKPDVKTPTKPEQKAELKSDVKSDLKADAAKSVKHGTDDDANRAMAILEGKAPAKTATKSNDGDHSSYVVQVAALATQEKVDELQSKLKAANIKSYTQKVATSSGDKIRIRIGPFESKEEADKMRAKLVKLGLNGSLVPN